MVVKAKRTRYTPVSTDGGREQKKPAETRIDQYGLTLAGIGVAPLGWSPRQVVMEIHTLFTVQTFGVVVAHTVTMNLQTQWNTSCIITS